MITTAVIPMVGNATGMLPLTKVIPQELMPVYDRPLIQYVVEEVLAAGIDRIIFVTNPEKKMVLQHFADCRDLITDLRQRNERMLIEKVVDTILPQDFFCEVHQEEPLGLGHAVLQARPYLTPGEAFAVVLPDEIYLGANLPMEQLTDFYQSNMMKTQTHLLGTKVVKHRDVKRFGIGEVGARSLDGSLCFSSVIEKPEVAEAPSNHALMGRYVLGYDIFKSLEVQKPGKSGRIELTDAINANIGQKPARGLMLSASRFGFDDRQDWLDAQLAFANAQRFDCQQLKYYKYGSNDLAVANFG